MTAFGAITLIELLREGDDQIPRDEIVRALESISRLALDYDPDRWTA